MTNAATTHLRRDHDLIRAMLDLLEGLARSAAGGGAVDAALLEEALDLVRTFVEASHHAKEMEILLPALVEHGLWRRAGALAVMTEEHDLGKTQLAALERVLADVAAGAPGAAERWAAKAIAFVHLIRDHMRRENGSLLLPADRLLSREEQESLGRELQRLELERLGPGGRQRIVERVAALREKLEG